jgi:hypothetical protein
MPPLLFQAVGTAVNDHDNNGRRDIPNTSLGARKLWGNTRRVDSTWVDTCRAILYELQIVRFSIVVHHMSNFDKYSNQIFSALTKLSVALYKLLIHHGGKAFRQMLATYLTWTNVAWIGGILVYFYAIRILHSLFYAGPIIIILTAMIIIWTIGLQDNDHEKNVGAGIILSAYSVFNRHCRSMLGSLDADALVEQYVAGAAAAGGGLAAAHRVRMPDHRQRADGDEQALGVPQQQQQQQRPTSRKSGKKARRGNLEQRRDRQRQRQIAAEMGFINEEVGLINEIEEQLVDENDL